MNNKLSFHLVTFSEPFLNRLKTMKSLENIRNELISYSSLHNIDSQETIYFYVRTILKNGTYFKYNQEISEGLFFEAAYWSSKKETKQKIRPKNFNDIKEKKNQKLFSKLQKSITLALIEEYYDKNSDLDNIKFKLELNKYIETMYEISCIKRDRLKK
jgi:flagella basal body P-ring formation protein FlgA